MIFIKKTSKDDWRDSNNNEVVYFNWARWQPSMDRSSVWIDSGGYWWSGEKETLGDIFCVQQLSGPVKNVCTLKNAKYSFIGKKYYCGANIGTFSPEDGEKNCRIWDSKLPLPKNSKENKEITNFVSTFGKIKHIYLDATDSTKSGF